MSILTCSGQVCAINASLCIPCVCLHRILHSCDRGFSKLLSIHLRDGLLDTQTFKLKTQNRTVTERVTFMKRLHDRTTFECAADKGATLYALPVVSYCVLLDGSLNT